ncbi:hypothetical protein [Streptomyces pacificus]|uniref:Transmembrane protein n=1 Tax=Streptomyces pacificus TaxID=2705029 RepID=A0A6A0B1X8_9ACTN|nr:hypothetical protein [Streptomyces pacificus]GFH38685.1 hypothetical protein SCWH03_49330 [Streptomyces pacificus]
MNSAPHLHSEDRAEYERVLNDVLRTAHNRPELDGIGRRLTAEQLRTMALKATSHITGAAAAEYGHYVTARQEARASAGGPGGGPGPAAGAPSETGAGFAAVITVLAPVLAGTAALILLLVGYVLKAVSPDAAFAETLLTAGWFFGALTAAGLLAAAIGLLVTALRNRATQVPAEDATGELPDEVARAKEAWRHALLERGVLPFLRAALADPGADPASHTPPRAVNRIPKVGYSGPDFSSPSDGGPTGPRPTFTSPDFTSPDFGPPENRPE